MKAMTINIIFIHIGKVPSISATTGAKIVAVLATTLLNPKTLAAKRVGISFTLPMYVILKAEDMPNFAKDIKNGIWSGNPHKMACNRKTNPRILTKNDKIKPFLAPTQKKRTPLARSATTSESWEAIVLSNMFPSILFIK